jgi:hypothetical protein
VIASATSFRATTITALIFTTGHCGAAQSWHEFGCELHEHGNVDIRKRHGRVDICSVTDESTFVTSWTSRHP